jgi:hypothetical protein
LVTLAATAVLGLGAAAVTFNLAGSFLDSLLPYDDPGRLALIWRTNLDASRGAGSDKMPLSFEEFDELRKGGRS